jgi:hypothetical protein
MAIMTILLAALSALLAWHALKAVRSGIMPMRVAPARRATRPHLFRAVVAIELVLAAAALAGAIAFAAA